MNFEIILIDKPVLFSVVEKMAESGFGVMVKGVVDTEKRVLALGAEMHFDEEQYLLSSGSEQKNLWGFNIRKDLPFPECVEFDSMINIRPRQGNMSRSVESVEIQEQILEIISELIHFTNEPKTVTVSA